MGFVKAVLIIVFMIVNGFFAFLLSLLALAVSPVFPSLRYYANLFFIVPFGIVARKIVGIRIVELNRKRADLARPAILIGNHQTGLDFAIISKVSPKGMLIVGKRELINIPIFGWFFWIAGNVLIDRTNPRAAKKQLEEASLLLRREKLNLAIFPEGTRSKNSEILPFKKGAFHMAISMGLPIVPVVCSSLRGKAIWEKYELNGGFAVVSVLEPVSTEGVTLSQVDALVERVRNLMVEEFARVNELALAYDKEHGKNRADPSCCS